jgi:hypothetical protein
MIGGVHTILYSKDAGAVRAFFRDVLGFPSVHAGHGWLIFAAPPAEMAIHPARWPFGCVARGVRSPGKNPRAERNPAPVIRGHGVVAM